MSFEKLDKDLYDQALNLLDELDMANFVGARYEVLIAYIILYINKKEKDNKCNSQLQDK